MDVDPEPAAAAVLPIMDGVLMEIRNHHRELRADARDQRESFICTAISNLGNAASPETRMRSFLPSPAQFEEVRELGEGEHGVVVEARDSVTGETVALKGLHPKPRYPADSNSEEDEYVEEDDELSTYRILREACFLAACRGHPSLVELSALGRHPRTGKYFLVMERVGPNLLDVLEDRQQRPFPERDVRRMMRQVLSGAKAMHDRGVVHRAINSTNILVADGGDVVKIGDFGEAASTSLVLEWRSGLATRASHLAPECLLGEPRAYAQEAMDSWSMGCLMLELLTGDDQFCIAGDDGELEGSQLQRIDDVLGLSCDPTSKISPEVQRYRAQRRGVSRLRQLVPPEVLSNDGFAVLQGLLMHSPEARLTAAEALQLPWFADNDVDSPPHSLSRLFIFITVLALLFLVVFVCRYCCWW